MLLTCLCSDQPHKLRVCHLELGCFIVPATESNAGGGGELQASAVWQGRKGKQVRKATQCSLQESDRQRQRLFCVCDTHTHAVTHVSACSTSSSRPSSSPTPHSAVCCVVWAAVAPEGGGLNRGPERGFWPDMLKMAGDSPLATAAHSFGRSQGGQVVGGVWSMSCSSTLMPIMWSAQSLCVLLAAASCCRNCWEATQAVSARTAMLGPDR